MSAIYLGGLECHVCGLPSSWWSLGVSIPCGCGQRTSEHGREALHEVRLARERARHAPKPAPKPPVVESVEVTALREVFACLAEMGALTGGKA